MPKPWRKDMRLLVEVLGWSINPTHLHGFLPARSVRTAGEEIIKANTIVEVDAKDAFHQMTRSEIVRMLISEQKVLLEQKNRRIAEQDVEIDRLLPKALYTDSVLESISCYTTTQIAKELGMTAQELNRWLCAERIQYYQSGQYMLYADYAHRGLAKS